jgi:uncharacterized protein YwgA
MTVGIHYKNKDCIVTIADKQVSMASGRQFNTVTKAYDFKTENYHGVLYGAGLAEELLDIGENITELNGESIENLVSNVYNRMVNNRKENTDRYIKRKKEEIEAKAKLFPDSVAVEIVSDWTRSEIGRALKEMDDYAKDPQKNATTEIILDVYDEKKQKLRSFGISYQGFGEMQSEKLEIGSGADAANLYGNMKTQGIELRDEPFEKLLFHAVNAYSASTINRGVGGTPNITVIDKKAARPLSKEKVAALTNISGAYLSELPGLTREDAEDLFSEIVKDEHKWAEKACGKLGITEDTLVCATTPYSTWQEIANEKRKKLAKQNS